MAKLRIRHLVTKRNADGTARFYWQPAAALVAAGWRSVPLGHDEAEAIATAERLNADVDAWRRGETPPGAPPSVQARSRKPAPGTVSALIAAYKASRFWTDKAPRTRASYQYHLDRIEAWAGDVQVRSVTAPAVEAFYAGLLRRVEGQGKHRRVVETPAMAAATIRVLRLLMSVAVRLGYLPPGSNPAARPGISYSVQREPRIWTEAEVRHMAAAADALGWRSMGTAIVLNHWIGQREDDVLNLAPWAFEAEALVLQQGKTKRKVALPVYLVPHLVERLKAEAAREAAKPVVELLAARAAKRQPLLLRHEGTGERWNEFTFRHTFAEVRALAAAGDPKRGLAAMPSCAGLLFKELRHTAVTVLHEHGVDEKGISGITGHTIGSIKQILDRHYLVHTEKAAVRAFTLRLAGEQDSRTRRPGPTAAGVGRQLDGDG
jgi:hypothetical protein